MTNYDAYGERMNPRLVQMTEHGAKFLVEVPSLRDQFAIAALVEFAGFVTVSNRKTFDVVAEQCYIMADAMMKQREVGNEK